MTPRTGRRIGRTRLQLKHVAARYRAIAKLDDLDRRRQLLAELFGDGTHTTHRLELPGHHLQRAAAENA